MTIGDRIKEARAALNFSQLDLALRLGVTQGAIGQYERGVSLPSLNLAVPLARELQVSTDWLLGMDSAPLVDVTRSLAKLSELALLRQLTKALDAGDLTGSQISLLGELVKELSKANKLESAVPMSVRAASGIPGA
jgi:transcriptional regulator with XRE-family HTH domain